jgi:hypothetical protein
MLYEFGIFPVAVDIYLEGYEGRPWETAPFRHRSGWLMVSEARMVMPFGTWRRPLIACISDQGEVYAPSIAARLLAVPISLPKDPEIDPPEALEEAMDALYWDFLGAMDLENMRYLHDAEERVEGKIQIFEAQCAGFERKLFAIIRELRSERRREGVADARREAVDAHLKRLGEMLDELAHGMRLRAGEMRRETEELEKVIFSSLTDHGEIEHLYTVHWTARRGRRGMTLRFPLFQEEPYSAEAWRNSDQSGIPHGSVTEELTAIRFGVQE